MIQCMLTQRILTISHLTLKRIHVKIFIQKCNFFQAVKLSYPLIPHPHCHSQTSRQKTHSLNTSSTFLGKTKLFPKIDPATYNLHRITELWKAEKNYDSSLCYFKSNNSDNL